MVSAKTRERIRQVQLGRPKTAEHRENLRRARLGKKHSPETRQRMSLAQFRRWAKPGACHSSAAREKYRQRAREQWRDPAYRQTMIQSRLRQTFPQKMTSIERLLRDEFKKRRLKFEMHKTMLGRFQPDFVFEQARLIVQADGDYWHNKEKGKQRDIAFAEAVAGTGWSVWRFGEREIQMHAAACARAVARFVREHGAVSKGDLH